MDDTRKTHTDTHTPPHTHSANLHVECMLAVFTYVNCMKETKERTSPLLGDCYLEGAFNHRDNMSFT